MFLVEKKKDSKDTTECETIPGFIILLESKHAFVVASSSFFHQKVGYKLVARFPDGYVWSSDDPEILTDGKIALIDCFNSDGYDTSQIQQVTLCRTPVKDGELVHTFNNSLKSLTSGTVMGVGDDGEDFQHNCAGTSASGYGALVFDTKAELLGMCYDFTPGYLKAKTIEGIARQIGGIVAHNSKDIDIQLGILRQSINP
ncbi:hypothetical protein ACP4OV_019389 [Aristida adscensionis]